MLSNFVIQFLPLIPPHPSNREDWRGAGAGREREGDTLFMRDLAKQMFKTNFGNGFGRESKIISISVIQ